MVKTRKMQKDAKEQPIIGKFQGLAHKRWSEKSMMKQLDVQKREAASAKAREVWKLRHLKQANEKLRKAEKDKATQNQLQLEKERKAILSAKRKQAAASRWNKSAVKEDQRTKAVDKTRKKIPIRKSISVTLLGKMQAMAKGSFLSGVEIAKFKMWSEEYFETMMTCFPQMPVTPKCHILCQHVSEFMDKHRFWGLLSEQSIEALHCKVNGDERRLSCMRERMKTLKKILEDSFVRNILFDVKVFDL